MDRRLGFNLQDAPQLQPFLLPSVRSRGRTIGGGSYGTVEELDVQGLLCAGKKLYSIFFERENQDATRILQRFVEECSLLADLRHPHIVQFLGICFLDGSDLPVLVMEYLPYCLDSLLEGDDRVELPLAMKCSILHDVALGLNHMHARIPPVIHRDLTAKNILLTSAMTGKIADLGVARILNQQPGRLAVTMTQTPGTLAYMPPEVLEENPKYNSTIDMFSFGHLTLFTIVQDFPYPTPAAVMDPSNPGRLMARSEVQRRSRQMEQLSCHLGGERHPLLQLVTQCLHNDPRQRPSARQVLSQLEEMRTNIEDRYEHMSKLELIEALRRREEGEGEGALQAQVTQLQGQLQEKEVELEVSRAEIQQVQHQLESSQAEIQQVQDHLRAIQVEAERYCSQVEQVQSQLQASQAEVLRYRSRLEQVAAQLQTKLVEAQQSQSRVHRIEIQWRADNERLESRVQQAEDSLRSRDQEIQELRAQLRRREAEITELTRTTHQAQPHVGAPSCLLAHQPPRSLNWRQGRNMLFGTAVACAVVLNGKVYVGGGVADRDEDEYIIQVYAPESAMWSRLRECPMKWFAMAVVTQQLVLVGGYSRDGHVQSTVHVLDSTTHHWTTPYPNMPTARRSLVAVGYQHFLVVAGGHSGGSHLPTVEILNTSTKRWYAAAQLPIGCRDLTPALVGDTLYLLGGWSGLTSPNRKMLSMSLLALISYATSTPQAPPPTWNVTGVELKHSAAIAIQNGYLLTVGGEDDSDRHSSAIHLYNPQTRQWTKVGDIPTPLSWCSCVLLGSGELVVLGGRDVCRSNKLYFATIY